MSYTIRKFDGTELVVLRDGTIDTSTSMALVGRNYTGYGELQNQNFVYLLENFANEAPPSVPVVGQTWFNTENNNLHVYDGSNWSIVGTATVSASAPENPPSGSLWFDSDEGKLYCWIGVWIAIGPENVAGFGKTKAESTSLLSDIGSRFPVIIIYVNDNVQAIYSSTAFTISPLERPQGFIELIIGLNFPNRNTAPSISGNLKGTAEKATILETTRLINGFGFNGSQDITITAATPFPLTKGDYIVGNNFNGSSNVTWSVDATSNNTIGTIVARDSAGDFSAGTISANLIGNVQGNVTAATGTSAFNVVTANQFIGASLSGNANTATRLRTPRFINGVEFDGTLDITVPVSGDNVTGSRLANNIVNSNLSTLGTLTELRVEDAGISIGNILNLSLDSGVPTIVADNNQGLYLSVQDPSVGGNYSSIEFIAAAKNLAQGGESTSAVIPRNIINLGDSYSAFNKIYSTTFVGDLQGNSSTATSATTSNNIAGGAAGAIPYQLATGITAFLPAGVSGQVLRSGGAGQPTWGSIAFSTLTRGNFLTGSNYDGIVDTTWSVDATSVNTANKVVARDSSGNFSANVITATLNGNITGNAVTANFATSAGTATTATTATNAVNATNATNAVNADTANVATTASFSTTQSIVDSSTKIATTAFVQNRLNFIPKPATEYFSVILYDDTFRWGDGVLTGDFSFSLGNTRFISDESFYIELSNPSTFWYLTGDPGRVSEMTILRKRIDQRYGPTAPNAWLRFTVRVSGYPMPNQLRIKIYAFNTAFTSPLTLDSSTRPLA